MRRMQPAWNAAKLSACPVCASAIHANELPSMATIAQRSAVAMMHAVISRCAPKRCTSRGACQNIRISHSTPIAHSTPTAKPSCPWACRCRVKNT